MNEPRPVSLVITTTTTGEPAKVLAAVKRRLVFVLGEAATVELLRPTPNGH